MSFCQACHLEFDDFELQRAHYKTDFHRFNLKRKVAGLPHVPLAVFESKVANVRAEEQTKKAASPSQFCTVCRKKFLSEKTYNVHLDSKKHKDTVRAKAAISPPASPLISPDPTPIALSPEVEVLPVISLATEQPSASPTTTTSSSSSSSSSSSEESNEASQSTVEGEGEEEKGTRRRQHHPKPPTPPKDLHDMTDEELILWRIKTGAKLDPEVDCLFCNAVSDDLEENIKHMSLHHRFFIPDFNYLVDPRALLKYLGKKITVGFLCLWCNEKGRSFHSLDGVRDHMRTMSHCKFTLENAEEEFERFYDYSSSYERFLLPIVQDGTLEAAEYSLAPRPSSFLAITHAPSTTGGSGDEAEESAEGEAADSREERLLQTIEHRARQNIRLSECGTELTFADGTVAGHRAFRVYHKQKFTREDSRVAVVIGRIMDHYKKYGYVARVVDEETVAARKQYSQAQNTWRMQLGVKANRLQHHFRRRDL